MNKPIQVEQTQVDALIPFARNARTHSDEQVKQIAASIREFGFNNPILIRDDLTVIAGHGRLAAAKVLGLKEVPTISLSHLTPLQVRAYVLADNKLAMNAGWDDEMLALELKDIEMEGFDVSLAGFDEAEMSSLLADNTEEGLTDEDAAPESEAKAISRPGDVWICGRHRVMCGDSTSIDAINTLMNGNQVDLVFTDPPYNVAFNGRSGKHDVIKNDDLNEDEFDQFIGEVLQTIKSVNPSAYYIWCNWRFYATLQRELEYKSCIVWAKNVFGMGTNYRHQHEFCLFNGEIDSEIKNESDLWSVKKDTNYIHPTQKPVELSERALRNHKTAQHILDLFGGSGSTLIGCERMNRIGHLMELDPKYVDVIVKRWQDYTGKKAVLESNGKTFDELQSK